ncbi:MAG TPA: glycosyl hydrolase family 79 C-terminal domain-containing protein, partial [Tepidisphaeraceae bacterium]|nr:glycosyl hydrolase family 79 C-terminal domain-containing protein [Tepidisphaeraceae bacterium]
IYGLNFGTGSPARDATEAAYVAHAVGSRLKYFQIGNEPDFYSQANNLLRPPGWGFDDYMNEWTAIADAVSARVPEARFGGPDMGASSDWVIKFAQVAPTRVGARLAMLSGHYYAMGPPDSPSATIANLLAPKPAVVERMQQIMPIARKSKLDYRMTEGNSCYRGGKPDVSNALAGALWGGDYELAMAALGCKGVNFHGGGGSQISASLGTKLPGVRNDADRKVANLGAFYTPIAGSREASFSARPLFYGMMLAEQFAGTKLVRTTFDSNDVNVTEYAGRDDKGGYRIALFNKDDTKDVTVTIIGQSSDARVWRLSASALDATVGVTLAGAEIDANETWRAARVEKIQQHDGALIVTLPHASAALLFINKSE